MRHIEMNQIRNSLTIALRLDDKKDKDIQMRIALEDSYAPLVKSAIRDLMTKENLLENIHDAGNLFTVYSPLRDLTFILHDSEDKIELLGMCKGELKKEFAEAYAGQYYVMKQS